MGLYLRYSGLNRTGSVNQHVFYYRGIPEIARKQQMELHNRWNLEFDTTYLPGYEEFMDTPVTRLADAGVWTERVHLKDTWEEILLLYLPVLDWDGEVRGICGVELSELYFRLSYPFVESNYGGMVTILAPLEGDQLLLGGAMLGISKGLRLESQGTLHFKEDTYYNLYSSGSERYIGLHQTLNCSSVSGRKLAVVTLVSEAGYHKISASSRAIWIVGSVVFLLCMLTLSLFLSRHFVKPILLSIKSIQDSPEEEQSCGLSEIDELLALLRSKSGRKQTEGGAPPDLEGQCC